ncbi:hypothetical protein [Sphingomonas sp. SAFR-052]|uniref:hypothetical protein n=1 Tax=Sphingomonas sp. SAFR-052 TaxID=3436867 RepID=UPI003F7D1748
MNDMQPFVPGARRGGYGADIATMVIATQGASRSSAFDLGRPLLLLGGQCLGPCGIVAQLAMDWLPRLTDLLGQSCRRQLSLRRLWFWLPPTALIGATSSEAYFVARRIARLAGVPLLVMDAGNLRPDDLRRSDLPGPDLLLPPDPVVAVAASGCANPLVLVLGIEHAPERTATELADMLDRKSGARWFCASLGAVLDLSAVTWMVATSNEHALQTDLYTRLTPVGIAVPRDRAPRMARLLATALEVMADQDVGPGEVKALLATMLQDGSRAWDRLSRSDADDLREAMTRELLSVAYASAD